MFYFVLVVLVLGSMHTLSAVLTLAVSVIGLVNSTASLLHHIYNINT